MKRITPLLMPLMLLALVAMCGFAALSLRQPKGYDYAAEQAKIYELQRQQADDAATAPARQIGLSLLWIAAGVAPMVLLGTWYADRKRKRELISPTREGLYPIPDPVQLAKAMESITQPLAQQIAAQLTATLYTGQMTASVAAQRPAPRQLLHEVVESEPAQLALPPPAAPVLALPEQAALVEHMPGRGKLVYGVLPNGQALTLPLAAGYHMLAHGDTRSGKTNWIDGMIVQLHHQAQHYEIDIIAGDFKRELAATWRRSPLLSTVETDPQAIAEQLEHIVHGEDGILERYTRFEELGNEHNRIVRNMGDYVKITRERPRLRFVIIDEINALLEACSKTTRLAPVLKQVLQTGAGAGVYMLGGAQYLTAQVFGRDGSKQFVTRCHFGAYDQNACKVMFSQTLEASTRDLITGQPGRGLIRTVGQNQPQAFQALRCEEDDILDAIELARGRTSPAEQAAGGSRPPSRVIVPEVQFIPLEVHRSGSKVVSEVPEVLPEVVEVLPEVVVDPVEAALEVLQKWIEHSEVLPADSTTKAQIQAAAEEVQRRKCQGQSKTAIIRGLWGATGGTRFQAAGRLHDHLLQLAQSEPTDLE